MFITSSLKIFANAKITSIHIIKHDGSKEHLHTINVVFIEENVTDTITRRQNIFFV